MLHLTLREDLVLELGLGEVVVPPGTCRARGCACECGPVGPPE